MKNMIKLACVLAAYTVVACVGLACIYTVTAPIIAAKAAEELKASLRAIYPDASDFSDVSASVTSPDGSVSFDSAYVAKEGDRVAGMVVKATGPTYSTATILVGVNGDRTVKTIKFMSISDTPGLGSKATDAKFKGQFDGKSLVDAFAAGSKSSGADIAAISGATITSKGVSRIVKLAGDAAAKYLADNYGSKQ